MIDLKFIFLLQMVKWFICDIPDFIHVHINAKLKKDKLYMCKNICSDKFAGIKLLSVMCVCVVCVRVFRYILFIFFQRIVSRNEAYIWVVCIIVRDGCARYERI